MKIVYSYVLFLISFIALAQNNTKDILFTIDDKPYTSEEFVRVYKKNLDLVKDESQRNIDQYLDLFVAYKLKVNKAYKLGLHENTKYKSELQSYRSQLAKGYLGDKKVTNELIEEAYSRFKKEVKASHILITLDQYALPADTLKAYNELKALKERAEKGEDFGVLAEQYSKDPSAKTNKGKLGYFSAFKMVYPFENAAFTTPSGKVSMPFRTRFGYHIIKVDDVRDNRGSISLEHIMLFKKVSDTAKVDPKNKINDIYKKIQQGENFESLAKIYSEDKGSAAQGGKLDTFNSGEIGSEIFEDKAFALKNANDISEPFESEFGFHIIKLLQKFPVKTLKEMHKEIEQKVQRDDRSMVIKKSQTDILRTKYKIVDNNKSYVKVVKGIDDSFYDGKWEMKATDNNKDVLFTLDNNKNTSKDFLTYLQAQQKNKVNIKPISALVDFYYKKYKDEQLNMYYNQNLEKEFPEFEIVMNEYKEGILLFDLMEKEIWNKAKTDTIGLAKFYDLNKEKYKWQDRFDVQIASSTDKKVIENVRKMLLKNKDIVQVKEKINTGGKVNVMIESGVYERDSEKLPKNYQFTKGISEIIQQGNYYYVITGNNFMPSAPKLLKENKGKTISDYQQSLESNWVSDLKKEFKVTINTAAFENIKKDLK